MRKVGCLQLRVAVLPRHRLERNAILEEVLQVGAERVEPVLQVIMSRCRFTIRRAAGS